MTRNESDEGKREANETSKMTNGDENITDDISPLTRRCRKCGGTLITLETFCTDAYEGFDPLDDPPEFAWYRDIKKRCVCKKCGLHQDVTVKTVKQDQKFK